jgi:hypothetical protein
VRKDDLNASFHRLDRASSEGIMPAPMGHRKKEGGQARPKVASPGYSKLNTR